MTDFGLTPVGSQPSPEEAGPEADTSLGVSSARSAELADGQAPDIVLHSVTTAVTSATGAPPVVRVALEVPPGVSIQLQIEARSAEAPTVVRHESIRIDRADPQTPQPGAIAPRPSAAPTAQVVQRPSGITAPKPSAAAAESAPTPFAKTPAFRLVSNALARLRADAWPATRSQTWILTALFAIYLITHLAALDRLPIFFFSDEAHNALMGQTAIRESFSDSPDAFLPVYFEVAQQRYAPVISAYVLGQAALWFGNSVEVVRATSVLLSSLAVLFVALIALRVFDARYWWISLVVFSLSPVWMIHSRTGFENAPMAAFYAGFLLFYLLYRVKSPWYGFPALLFAGLTFYSYSNSQAIMVLTAFLLVAVDLRYHLGLDRRLLAGLAAFTLLLASPLITFQLSHQDALSTHLRAVNSYLFDPGLTIAQKAGMYATRYLYGLSPQYWFWPNETDLVRHRMPDQAQIWGWGLPFFVLGVWAVLRRWNSPAHRIALLAALTAPAGAATLEIGASRMLTFVPAATILITLGVDWFVARLPRLQRPLTERLAVGLAGLGMAASAFWMIQTAPFWYSNYGLYGMQYGAKQLFDDVIPTLLRQDPETRIMVSSSWANGTDLFREFFLDGADYERVEVRGIDWYQTRAQDLDEDLLFISTAEEFAAAKASGKFEPFEPEQVVPFPDGTPGFYVFRARYSAEAEAIFAAEAEERRRPETEEVMIAGQSVSLTHSRFDMGGAGYLFDADAFTLVRGLEANPLVFDLGFAVPRPVTALLLTTGTMDRFTVTARAYPIDVDVPVIFAQSFVEAGQDPTVRLDLPIELGPLERLIVELHDELAGEPANIHVRDLILEP